MPPNVAIIADDFTGLQAIAGEFARAGFNARKHLSHETFRSFAGADVVGLDTNSRALSRDAAVGVVSAAAQGIKRADAHTIYKQCDSGMQGHIAAEAEAIGAVLNAPAIVYCPACPGMGRITRDGRQTAGGTSPGAVLDVDIRALWREQTGRSPTIARIASLNPAALAGTLVVDAETDQELLKLAKMCLDLPVDHRPLLVGSVGFANAVALCLRASLSRGGVLIVAGSLQAATLQQMSLLSDIVGCEIDPLPIVSGDTLALNAAVSRAVEVLRSGRHCILASPHGATKRTDATYPYVSLEAITAFNVTIVNVLRAILPVVEPLGIVVAGGMTSEHVARDVLGVTTTTADTWLAAGTTAAIATDKRGHRVPFVTKAGTWGDADTLLRSLVWIQNANAKNNFQEFGHGG